MGILLVVTMVTISAAVQLPLPQVSYMKVIKFYPNSNLKLI